jgi:hypothetical protein
MTIIKTDRTKQELGTINERTSFFDDGTEIHTVTIKMGETRIDIQIHKRNDGTLTTPDIDIHNLKGECSVFTEHDEKITKKTKNHTLDCGTKFKVVDLEVA